MESSALIIQKYFRISALFSNFDITCLSLSLKTVLCFPKTETQRVKYKEENEEDKMTTDQIKEIIERNQKDIAFIVGNGVNRYPNNPNALSWDELLIQLWDKVSFQTLSRRPVGISLTEFYDIFKF